MTDIPEDIMIEARKLFDGYSMDAVMAAARAILAERERCAQIVKTWGQDDQCIQPMFGPLAAAIRSPERAGE